MEQKADNNLSTSKTDETDVSIHLPLIEVISGQGILNASDVKEIKKILFHKDYHYLVSTQLLRFVESFKAHSQTNEEKKDTLEDEKIDMQQEIRTFQTDIRACIQQFIQLSYSSAFRTQIQQTNNNCSPAQILNKVMENTVLSKDILYLMERSILSMTDISTETMNLSNDETIIITMEQCCNVLNCPKIETLNDNKAYMTLKHALSEQISVYKECMELLTDEINMLQSIFSAEHDNIVVHSQCYPIIIELCLCSANKYAQLYLTFLAPIDYPLQPSGIKCCVYFNGPTDFASSDEIWLGLQSKLQQMSSESIGEQCLFDMVQFAKEWLEKYEENYTNLTQKQTVNNHRYICLRSALGLVSHSEQNTHKPIVQINTETKEQKGTKPDFIYIWFWKDINRNWNEYPKNMQLKINNLPISTNDCAPMCLSFSTNNYDYKIVKISEGKGIQTNCETMSQTQIKRKTRKLRVPNHGHLKKKNAKIEKADQYVIRRGRTKKERRKMRAQMEKDTKMKSKNKGKKRVEYYSDEEQDQILRMRQLQQKRTQKEQIRKEQLMTQVYSSWEIDQTIQTLITHMSIKWSCTKPMAKKRLAEQLWTSDTSIDKQLQQTRNSRNGDSNICDTEFENTEDITLVFPANNSRFECPICLELKSIFSGIKIHCGHVLCMECLSDYIFNQINNGITVIKCAEYKCKALLSDCLIHILSDTVTYTRYRHFLQNSFLETCRHWNFCPNPNCNCAIQTKRDIALLVCHCGIPLCTSCIDKFHWPLKCRENKQWTVKTKAKLKLTDPLLPELPKFEGQKYTMLVKTKQCPKCKTPWERNGGCNHIHCRKCKYHWCWVCLKEFNMSTHDDFYECKQGYVANTKKQTFIMEEPTQKYVESYQKVTEDRKRITAEHEMKIKDEILRKSRTKKAIQHERASIFLQDRYLKRERKMKVLLKNIIGATKGNNEKIPKKLDLLFIQEMISRMSEAHLLISRGYKYISYHGVSNENSTICNVLQSLEHIAFKLDGMFQEPKVYLPWTKCRWKWYDLGFYIDFFIQEMIKVCKGNKKQTKNYFELKPHKHNWRTAFT